MQIVLTKTLNPKRGYVEGAVFDWTKPVISEMDRQCKAQGITDWFRYSTEMMSRVGRIQTKEDGRAKYMDGPPEAEQSAPEAPALPPELAEAEKAALAAGGSSPTDMAEVLVRDSATNADAGLMTAALAQDNGEVKRVQRGPQRGQGK